MNQPDQSLLTDWKEVVANCIVDMYYGGSNETYGKLQDATWLLNDFQYRSEWK